ncbi:tctex1 domain-containing protein 1-B-like isoform X2 [Mizuhopecten yessoensis]|uniref:tctex1 domain-containing protein 1-B-like isoform X2 n=1 Tax=Mizuhopecten yessoensis TaxID=6573 RepID=UPI000B459B5A|nr:tctex1 domain-containing protein 1-B-like isoform X2 [Mizuhopecten yessoensis]
MTSDVARDKAARLLKKQGSMSSLASSDVHRGKNLGLPVEKSIDKSLPGECSMSTVSFTDDPGHDDHYRPPVKYENSYQTAPDQKFPTAKIRYIISDVLESCLRHEKYEPELCRQLSKTTSEIIKTRVREMNIPRFKIICLVHIGQLNNQGLRIGSRCLWDSTCDTFSSYEFRNNKLFAIGSVYGVYFE